MGTLLNGGELTVSLSNGAAFVNDIRIIATDIEVSNGVVHLIDNVLLPAN
ncbi:MAG: fasciclin domain-containing protein [Bacteroidota bacterium]